MTCFNERNLMSLVKLSVGPGRPQHGTSPCPSVWVTRIAACFPGTPPAWGGFWVAMLVGGGVSMANGQTRLLNDTGQTSCYNASGSVVACDAATIGNSGTRPHQDGRYGRDAAQSTGALPAKIGAGDAGFDFTKIANSGAALSAAAVLGSDANEWACTRDNHTRLTWEVKTTSGLRSNAHTYTWYFSTNNGGLAGVSGTDTCGGTLAAYSNQCNTSNYIASVNAAALCGFTNWRLPTRRELLSIVHSGRVAPSVDTAYFPNTQSDSYWSRDSRASEPLSAWAVYFNDGYPDGLGKHLMRSRVLLVRSEP